MGGRKTGTKVVAAAVGDYAKSKDGREKRKWKKSCWDGDAGKDEE